MCVGPRRRDRRRLRAAPARRVRGSGPDPVNDWVSGRYKIWDLAFPAGGQPPLFTENDSGVIFARMNGSERARPLGSVTQFEANFDPTGEGGLMGIALSPGFDGATNRSAFVCYSTTSDNRVARFDVNYAAGTYVTLSNWTPIVTGLPHSSIHNGCRVRFQPGTGALFVSTGDATPPPGRSRRWCSRARSCASIRTATPGPGTSPALVGTPQDTATHKDWRSGRDPTTRTPSSTAPTSTTRSTSS